MAINSLNSGAHAWLDGLEDADTPHRRNVVTSQVVLADAARGVLAHDASDGRQCRLRDDGRTAVVVARPHGWPFDEPRPFVDGAPAVAALVFHNAAALLQRGSGPYFYLSKIESHLEARLWNDVFVLAQGQRGIPPGRTTEGLRTNVGVGLRYIEAWLGGNGAVAIHNLMEDAATAEISRAQVWQWEHTGSSSRRGGP